ncbi:HupE/UreJ family protein [Lusitaniella coriacea LEGE 07157]|uniref:HupE/UreJ family protein n=1 Tax=Lusitaniella coriacea LEGE 07157 TaxID=945747 RepID=A0A8J7AW31_9CYAN|nr:HupE/UreJ family protein [Lusitaniella coriacea]MBE9114387.1 HupE/UreJ family protein [Lusitaniella coriacea LEGE 07157]
MKKLQLKNSLSPLLRAGSLSLLLALFITQPAFAHHPFGGKLPSNGFEGFLSGLGHPVIGADHFAFVVTIGLLAALQPQRAILIPIAFILTTLGGTGIHLLGVDLPMVEIVISASVVVFGTILAMKKSPKSLLLILLAGIAGIFHGYAYGEAIVGAEITPLVSYLLGFATIQLGIALLALQAGKLAISQASEQPTLTLRFAGFALCGAGVAFLSSVLLG